MSIFSAIMAKIGFGDDNKEAIIAVTSRCNYRSYLCGSSCFYPGGDELG